jgi:dCTP deaminase
MILTGTEIAKRVHEGSITISPFNGGDLNPNSYNYHLGDTFVEVESSGVIDVRQPPAAQLQRVPAEGMILHPGKLYLFSTHETIGSSWYVTRLIGKSSIGRLGLYLQVSADLGHQAQVHKWTLELRCVRPIKVYPYMVIGQVTFWKVLGEAAFSHGYYGGQDLPTQSRGVA